MSEIIGANWIKKVVEVPVSEFGCKVADILGELFNGIYHISKEALHKRVEWTREDWIEIVIGNHLASYDFDGLTKLVILCHKYKVRVEVEGAAPNYLKLIFYNSGSYTKEHPGINELSQRLQEVYSA